MNCLSLLLLPTGFAENGNCQDSLRAKEIDAIVNTKRKTFYGRLNRIRDTAILYQYDVETNEFYRVEEYIRLKETRMVHRYSYYNGELIKISICRCWRVKRSEERHTNYYFTQNQLIQKEEHGMPADKAGYFLQRGNRFLTNAAQRFLEPKVKTLNNNVANKIFPKQRLPINYSHIYSKPRNKDEAVAT